jgi:long-chain fatty acid transport protein
MLRLIILMTLCITIDGWAAGFSLMLKGIKGLGNSFAGGAASAEDASTIYYNPAGLPQLSSHQALIYGQIVRPYFSFTDEGSKTVLDQDLTGSDGGDAGKLNFLPGGFFSYKLTDEWFVGIGVVSPFGLSSEFDPGWKGRYHGISSSILTIDINPTIAYKISDHFLIGAGISAQYIDAELTNAIDYGSFMASVGMAPLSEAQHVDGTVKLEAKDWGFGYNCGILLLLNQNTRFGLSYRSKIPYEVSGRATFSTPPSASGIASAIGYVNTGGRTQIDMPGNVSISGYHQIDEKWAIMGDINWTNWDVLNKLQIQFDTGAPDNVITYEWEDALRYALGTTYTHNRQWAFRMGVAFEETPVPNARYRIPRIPDEDRYWLSIGAGYQFSDQLVLDIGYSFLFAKKADIDKTATGEDQYRGALKGSFEGHSNVFGAQLVWNFN